MLREVFYLAATIPGVKRTLVKGLYQTLTDLDKGADVICLNYGYASLDHPDGNGLSLLPEDEVNRLCLALHHRVAGAVDLSGKDVLEVGSGRGGGASYVARYLGPKTLVGLDLSAKAVAFCNRHYSIENLSFRQGDAEALPFPDASFDAVVNVESSHNYPSMTRFLGEVLRVLRPGGHLLITDHRERDKVEPWREQFRRCGFSILLEEDVTTNVIRALDIDNERKLKLIRQKVPGLSATSSGNSPP